MGVLGGDGYDYGYEPESWREFIDDEAFTRAMDEEGLTDTECLRMIATALVDIAGTLRQIRGTLPAEPEPVKVGGADGLG